MRLLALLTACPFISADDHEARVDALPGAIDPQIDEVLGGLRFRCTDFRELTLRGTVAENWAGLDFDAQVAVDDQPFVAAGTVRSGTVAGGRAAFDLIVPGPLLDVPTCAQDLCAHDLRLSLTVGEHEGSATVAAAIQRPGAPPSLVEVFVGGTAGAEPVDELTRLDDPANSVSIDDWWTLGAALADPWVAAGGDEHRYFVHVEQ